LNGETEKRTCKINRYNFLVYRHLEKDLYFRTLIKLIYKSKESGAYNFYHKSIVNAIMSVNPTGVKFISVEDWED